MNRKLSLASLHCSSKAAGCTYSSVDRVEGAAESGVAKGVGAIATLKPVH